MNMPAHTEIEFSPDTLAGKTLNSARMKINAELLVYIYGELTRANRFFGCVSDFTSEALLGEYVRQIGECGTIDHEMYSDFVEHDQVFLKAQKRNNYQEAFVRALRDYVESHEKF